MGNMSYCMFENALRDLEDCYDMLNLGKELSISETVAKKRLIELCYNIAQENYWNNSSYHEDK